MTARPGSGAKVRRVRSVTPRAAENFRRYARARMRAHQALKEAHPEEFARLLEVEKAREGIRRQVLVEREVGAG